MRFQIKNRPFDKLSLSNIVSGLCAHADIRKLAREVLYYRDWLEYVIKASNEDVTLFEITNALRLGSTVDEFKKTLKKKK